MADSDIAVTAGSGTLVDTKSVATGAGTVQRQVIDIGPSRKVIAPVRTVCSATAATLIAANTLRTSIQITNDQGGDYTGAFIYLLWGAVGSPDTVGTVSATNYSIRVAPDQLLTFSGPDLFLGLIQWVSSAATGSIQYQELESS